MGMRKMFCDENCLSEEDFLPLREKAIRRLDREMVFIEEKKIEEFKKKVENIFA